MYIHETDVHNTKAAKEVVPIILNIFNPNAVLDVGCGIGTWLQVFKQKGVKKIKGIDGNYVNREHLFSHIDEQEFQALDLSSPFDINERFDLAICLEVAEHLPFSSANDFVESLSKHSDIIIFGAAVPGQWGQNHLNEQWTEFWIELFNNRGYKPYDLLRSLIWDNKNVEWWYKQNILVFSKTTLQLPINSISYQSVIHPEHFEQKIVFIEEQNKELATLKSELLLWEESNRGVKKHWVSFYKSIIKKFTYR